MITEEMSSDDPKVVWFSISRLLPRMLILGISLGRWVIMIHVVFFSVIMGKHFKK